MNYRKMPSGYGMVQTAIMKLSISIQAKALYSLLASYTGAQEFCFPKIETICNDLNLSKPMVIKYLKELEQNNLIIKSKLNSKGNNNKYEMLYISDDKNYNNESKAHLTFKDENPVKSKPDITLKVKSALPTRLNTLNLLLINNNKNNNSSSSRINNTNIINNKAQNKSYSNNTTAPNDSSIKSQKETTTINQIYKKLKNLMLDDRQIENAVQKYDENYLKNKINQLDWLIKHFPAKIKDNNTGRYLYNSIFYDWEDSEYLNHLKQEEIKKLIEIEKEEAIEYKKKLKLENRLKNEHDKYIENECKKKFNKLPDKEKVKIKQELKNNINKIQFYKDYQNSAFHNKIFKLKLINFIYQRIKNKLLSFEEFAENALNPIINSA